MKIIRDEPVHLLARAHGYFPAAFRWRGRRFDVAAVERCWTTQQSDVRRLFKVRCAAGSFVLEQCVANDTWQVTRRPLAWLLPWPQPAPAARFPLPRRQRRPAREASAHQPAELAAPARASAARTQAERRRPWTAASQRL